LRAVVGLGNVGPEYAATRHNVGFWVIERLLAKRRWRLETHPWGEVYRGPAGFLVRPLTFMNRSGDAARGLLALTSLAPSDLLVVYDEADLPVGALRLQASGGPGTHRGMESVLAALGTDEVPRLRVGIGQPAEGGDWARHVLSPPPPEHVAALSQGVDLAGELAWVFLSGGISVALDRFSREARGPDRII